MNELKKIEYLSDGKTAFYYGSVKGLYQEDPNAKLLKVTDFNLAEYEKQHH